MLPEARYTITRGKEGHNLADEYGLVMSNESLSAIFNEIRVREEEEGYAENEIEELEF